MEHLLEYRDHNILEVKVERQLIHPRVFEAHLLLVRERFKDVYGIEA
jgi:hypothetical protein